MGRLESKGAKTYKMHLMFDDSALSRNSCPSEKSKEEKHITEQAK